jgi:serine/threonine-protein kinase HipA
VAEPFVQLPAVEVRYQSRPVGAVAIDPTRRLPVFEYFAGWVDSGENLSPLVLPRARGVRVFPELASTSFRGAPGLVADSLPGTFANLLTNAWLARHGIQPGEVSVVDRLGYIGSRGVGALTFHPAVGDDRDDPASVVDLSEAVDTARRAISGTLQPDEAGATLEHLLDTSGSAGGARAKASVALGPDDEIRSGQHDAPDGFTHWLLKFDVAPGQRHGQTTGYGQLEYAYHLMAVDAGLRMSECRLLEVDGLVHFLTRRFDRPGPSTKLHVQSLAALAHLPPEHPGAHSYEQFLQTCMRLDLDADNRRHAFRQIVFNIAAAVRDDHTKNFAFIYEGGSWRLAPAFDLNFAFLDGGGWLTHHQLTIAGSAEGANRPAMLELAERAKVPDADTALDDVTAAVGRWPQHSEAAGVLPGHADIVARELSRTTLVG